MGWCRCSILEGMFHISRVPIDYDEGETTEERSRRGADACEKYGSHGGHSAFCPGPQSSCPHCSVWSSCSSRSYSCSFEHIALHRSARSGQLSLGQVIDCLRACGPNTKYRIFSQLQIWPPASAEKKGSRNGHHLTICCIFKKLPLCQSSQEKVFWHMSREIYVLVNLSEYEYLLSVSFGIEKAFRLDVAQPRRLKLMAAD